MKRINLSLSEREGQALWHVLRWVNAYNETPTMGEIAKLLKTALDRVRDIELEWQGGGVVVGNPNRRRLRWDIFANGQMIAYVEKRFCIDTYQIFWPNGEQHEPEITFTRVAAEAELQSMARGDYLGS